MAGRLGFAAFLSLYKRVIFLMPLFAWGCKSNQVDTIFVAEELSYESLSSGGIAIGPVEDGREDILLLDEEHDESHNLTRLKDDQFKSLKAFTPKEQLTIRQHIKSTLKESRSLNQVGLLRMDPKSAHILSLLNKDAKVSRTHLHGLKELAGSQKYILIPELQAESFARSRESFTRCENCDSAGEPPKGKRRREEEITKANSTRSAQVGVKLFDAHNGQLVFESQQSRNLTNTKEVSRTKQVVFVWEVLSIIATDQPGYPGFPERTAVVNKATDDILDQLPDTAINEARKDEGFRIGVELKVTTIQDMTQLFWGFRGDAPVYPPFFAGFGFSILANEIQIEPSSQGTHVGVQYFGGTVGVFHKLHPNLQVRGELFLGLGNIGLYQEETRAMTNESGESQPQSSTRSIDATTTAVVEPSIQLAYRLGTHWGTSLGIGYRSNSELDKALWFEEKDPLDGWVGILGTNLAI